MAVPPARSAPALRIDVPARRAPHITFVEAARQAQSRPAAARPPHSLAEYRARLEALPIIEWEPMHGCWVSVQAPALRGCKLPLAAALEHPSVPRWVRLLLRVAVGRGVAVLGVISGHVRDGRPEVEPAWCTAEEADECGGLPLRFRLCPASSPRAFVPPPALRR